MADASDAPAPAKKSLIDRFPPWLQGWRAYAAIAVASLLLVWAIFAIFVAVPNGTKVDVYIEAGTNEDGTMFYRCVLSESTAGACDPSGVDGDADQARITVHQRDRVSITVHSLDGGDRAHDFKLTGAAYAIPPSGIEMEMHKDTETKSFTAWKTGTFLIKCELPGHEGAGMWAQLDVV